jgi:hypothetical protein
MSVLHALSKDIHIHEFDVVQTLGELTSLEVIFVGVPEASTAYAALPLGMVTFPVRSEETRHMRVGNLRFELCDIEATRGKVDTRCTLFRLDLEHEITFRKIPDPP